MLLACMALSARADPPALAGHLSWLAGEVRLRCAHSPEQAVPINWPLTSGDVLSTGPTGRAEVWIGTTSLRLDAASRVLLQRVDEQQLVLRLEHGTLALRVAKQEAAKHTQVHTALGHFTPEKPGEFRLESAAIGASPPVATALTDDDFSRFVRQRDAAFAGRSAARYVSPEMTGIENLDTYGWGWVPGGYVARPVYAPALVGWAPTAGRAGAAVSVSGVVAPPVGWFPLGPREPYVPEFAASAAFVRSLNAGHAERRSKRVVL